MKKVSSPLLSLILILLFTACKKDFTEPTSPPEPTDTLTAKLTKEVEIIFPGNTNIDLASCKVFSLSIESGVNDKGKAKIANSKGFANIAYVFDKDDNVILAGFITDTTSTISVASTAEVLLYTGMGTAFLPYEIMNRFINGIGKVPGVPEWKKELENIFITDPHMLQKGLFVDVLKMRVAEIIKSGQVPKPADITVDANDIRSGLQLAENGLNSFIITNTFRRRSQAFIYKMKYKDLDGVSHTVNNEIFGSVTSIADLKISPTGAIRDFKGVLQDWAAGKGMEFAETVNGPIAIPLEENEMEADFKVRIVGPGTPVADAYTSYEKERLANISLQTLAFDYLLPLMMDAVGHKEALGQVNSKLAIGKDLAALEDFVESLSSVIATIPAAADAMEAGDYTKAATEVLFGICNGELGNAADDLIESIYEIAGDAVKEMGGEYLEEGPELLEKRGKKLLKVLEVIDMGMKLIDYSRITIDIARSKTLEEWDLKARELEVSLDPREFTLGPLDQKMLTANMKTSLGDNAPVIEYQWETTGKYGYLWDDRGHKGTSFSSSIKEAYYLCNALESDLGQGEHVDTIKVTVYLKSGQTLTKLGTAVSVAKISKDVFTLGWTPTVNINKRTDTYGKVTWDAGNPFFLATFAERKTAKSYTFRIIKKDGTKGAPATYFPSQLTIVNGIIEYRLLVGSLFLKIGMNESQMLEEKARQEKILADYVGNGIEVTVNY